MKPSSFLQSGFFSLLPTIMICLCFLILIGVGLHAIEEAENKRYLAEQRQKVQAELGILRASLEGHVQAEIGLSLALTGVYEATPDLSLAEFNRFSKIIMAESEIIRSIGLAEQTTIKYVYPYAANAKAIGKRYEDLPDQWPAVQRSIELQTSVIAGPVQLIQGGEFLILRSPVFTQNDPTTRGEYLGMISIIWKTDALLDLIDLTRFKRLKVSLIGSDGQGYLGDAIFGSRDILQQDPVTFHVDLPDGSWVICALPNEGWAEQSPRVMIYRLLALVTGLIVFLLSTLQLFGQHRRRRIAEDLRLSRDQLHESEQRYRILAENISDVIWIMEVESFRFTYMSSSIEKQRGIRASSAMRNSLEQTITTDSLGFFRKVLPERLAAFKTGTIETYCDEIEQPCADGQLIWTESLTQFYGNPTTGQIELYGVTRDITQRKKDLKEKESLILELQSAKKKLEALSMTDALTGLHNRRFLDEVLRDEWRRAQREPRPISMIIIDIDHFKRYNDSLGHPQGDRCLQQVAQVFEEMLNRPGDIAVRYGGEELIGVLPETDIKGALFVGQRLIDKFEELNIPHPDSPVAGYVTVSIGAATMVPNIELKPEDLLAKADSALYMAKKRGRNTIVTAAGDA